MSSWGTDSPPEDAYGRVTDPERFRPLHDAAARLVERLEMEFDVSREEGFDLFDPPPGIMLARPSIRLAPTGVGLEPIVIAFTQFPGIVSRVGEGPMVAFPACGCDACGGTGEEEIIRLSRLLADAALNWTRR